MQHPIKRPCKPLATALAVLLAIPILAAPRPLTWRADFPSARVENFPVRHGTDVEFRPSWYVNGSPADTNGWTYSLSVQTNGAPAGEWATITGTVFSHTNDCGAEAYNVLVRAVDRDGTVDYSAAARLRMLPSPGFSPGALPPAATFQESDPVFSAWLSTFTIPETSLEPSTNYTDRSLSAFSATGTVFRSASYGTPTRWTDATGCVWQTSLTQWYATNLVNVGAEEFVSFNGPYWWPGGDTQGVYGEIGWYLDPGATPRCLGNDADAMELVWSEGNVPDSSQSVTYRRSYVTNLVGRVALTNDIQRPPVTSVNSKTGTVHLSASDVSAYSAASGAALANTVDAWQSYWDGDEVRVTITNYFGSAGQPHLYIEQKVFDEAGGTNYYRTVWDEVTRQNILLARIVALETALAQKADRAWGFYDSHTGEFSPDGYTQVSSSNILLAAGMSYQKTITSGGEVWTLTATEPTQISGVGTNGFFRIADGDGNALFEIVKGTRRTVCATARAVSTAGGVFTIQYAVVADEHPVLQICSDLSLGDWADEGSTPRATVEWSGSSGNYTATVTPVGSQPKLFARASYEVGGNTYIKNNVASSLDRVVVNGTEYTVSVETVNGRKLMVLEVAP